MRENTSVATPTGTGSVKRTRRKRKRDTLRFGLRVQDSGLEAQELRCDAVDAGFASFFCAQAEAGHQFRQSLPRDAEFFRSARAMTTGPRQRGANELCFERSPRRIEPPRSIGIGAV